MVVVGEFKTYAQAHWQVELEQVNSLTANQVSQLAAEFNLSEDECLLNLLPMAVRYAPYSQSPAICAVTLESGISYYGAYAENAAFNPSLSPFQSALIQVRLSDTGFDQIERVELYEQEDAKILQHDISYSLFQAVSPTSQWHYETL